MTARNLVLVTTDLVKKSHIETHVSVHRMAKLMISQPPDQTTPKSNSGTGKPTILGLSGKTE
jgi:hypothetical protein